MLNFALKWERTNLRHMVYLDEHTFWPLFTVEHEYIPRHSHLCRRSRLLAEVCGFELYLERFGLERVRCCSPLFETLRWRLRMNESQRASESVPQLTFLSGTIVDVERGLMSAHGRLH